MATADPANRATLAQALLVCFQLAVIVPTLTLSALLFARDIEEFEWRYLLWSSTDRSRRTATRSGLARSSGECRVPSPHHGRHSLPAGNRRPHCAAGSVRSARVPSRSQPASSSLQSKPSRTFGDCRGIRLPRNRGICSNSSDLTTATPLILIVAASAAAIADYAVNSTLVTIFVSMRVGAPLRQVLSELRVGKLSDFLLSYLGLGILGLTLAVFYQEVGPWSLPAYLAPLLLARAMFFRSQALEEAHKELQEREQVLKTLSNAMAEERADERLQIAGYLHDDLAQVLFRLSIQVDVARKLMDKGELTQVTEQLDKIRESKQETSDRIRASDPRPPPLAAGGQGPGRGPRIVHRRGRSRLQRPFPPRRGGHPASGADRAARLPHRSRRRDERAQACARLGYVDRRP